MDTSFNILLVFLYTLAIDILARLAQHRSDQERYKPAGLLARGMLAVLKKPSLLTNQNTSLKRYFLALATALALLFALNRLLSFNAGMLMQKPYLFLALVPVFALPFYHFVYGSQTTSPLALQASLKTFRLRGILSILFACNMVFLQLEPMPSLGGIVGHGLFAFLALVSSFYLCAQKLQKASPHTFAEQEDSDSGQPAFLHYLAACLEVCFYTVLFYLVFIQPYLILIKDIPAWILDDKLLTLTLLVLTAATTKFFFYYRSPWTLAFFEEGLLPLSFLLFAIITFLQINA